ncbi:hypothetical protein H4R34_004721 [Dimargaris verticillata]|uniref:Cullin family profile domain-containing protein n=1 Tax=Dimargaris verticillata TaxID=2761393 RepID=A0A9W8EBX9_9FUNG|nr:hypothetical protein H4R34_004721 [Dimargaris verticillata]
MSFISRKPKAKIRPPKSRNSVQNAVQEGWQRLARAIQEIYRRNASQLSYEEVYRSAYTMVVHGKGEQLYQGVQDLIAEHLESRIKSQLLGSNAAGSTAPTESALPSNTSSIPGAAPSTPAATSNILLVIEDIWTEHLTCLLLIKDILMYMDRIYCPNAHVPVTYEVGLQLFRDHVIRSNLVPVQTHLLDAVQHNIDTERQGGSINRSTMQAIIRLLTMLPDNLPRIPQTVYQHAFEPSLLQSTTAFYTQQGAEWAKHLGAPDFLRRIQEALEAEDQRCDLYLTQDTKPKFKEILKAELIAQYAETLIALPTGVISLVNDNQHDTLRLMYQLFSLVPESLEALKQALAEHIHRLGLEINQQALTATASVPQKLRGTSKPEPLASLQWVQAVLVLKQRVDYMLATCFDGDKQFDVAFDQSFMKFVSQHPRAPELVSLFLDHYLKKGTKGKTEEEIDAIVTGTIAVFRFLTDRDVFERYYKQHLARRLLLDQSISADLERSVISMLKTECGHHFTSKLEGMFNDISVSADINRQFHEHLEATTQASTGAGFRLNVQVLTESYWPLPTVRTGPKTDNAANTSGRQTDNSVIIPPLVQQKFDQFTDFYLQRHSGRRLTWQHSTGNVDVRCRFKNRQYWLNVSGYQMLVLWCFDQIPDQAFLTFQELAQETGIPEYELRLSLRTLACGKYKLLTKDPKSTDIDPTVDKFRINVDFASPLTKLRIRPALSSGGDGRSKSGASGANATAFGQQGGQVESEQEQHETKARIEEARKNLVEAATVRIMKSRRQLGHNELLAEVTRQLQPRFMANPMMIKQRIEVLIDRDFLERDPNDRRIYHYLA